MFRVGIIEESLENRSIGDEMKNVIHIYGASGSGTSTLGRKISEELGYKFMDTDDYFWLPTNPKYTTKHIAYLVYDAGTFIGAGGVAFIR